MPAILPWRVAVTRDEDREGPLARALAAHGFVPVPCPVLVETPPADTAALAAAARDLDRVDWVIVASARAVHALTRLRQGPWPAGLSTAAVGEGTARALGAAGVTRPPVVGAGDGAGALWAVLGTTARWSGMRVLVPTTPGGRTDLADHLRAAGADVTTVEAYRMTARPPAAIVADWARGAPEAVVVASARTAETLAAAVGVAALRALPVVAIGTTTAAALDRLGVPNVRPARADFAAVPLLLAAQQGLETSP